MRTGRMPAALRTVAIGAAVVGSCLVLWSVVGPSRAGANAALLPPANPRHSLALDEHAQPDCTGPFDHAAACLDESVAILNAGRRSERLGPLVLPRNWSRLTVAEQIFVMTELERTARRLPPDAGLAASWSAAARAGADAGRDPDSGGRGAYGFGAIWAGGQANPIVATVGWIYDDGLFPDGSSQNGDCLHATDAGCWGHRDIMLHDTSSTACVTSCALGAAYSAEGFVAAESAGHHESYAEVFPVSAHDTERLTFSWHAELAQLPACERSGDSCGWAGRPLLTSTGYRNVRGSAGAASPAIRPWFRVSFDWHADSSGQVDLAVSVGAPLAGIVVSASDAHGDHLSMRVGRASASRYSVQGSLPPGRWAITIVYRTPPAEGPSPSSTVEVTVPAAA